MSTKPLVSIVCLTYNEEQFVRECFDSFLAQETTFPYEVLVYDDASTDGTPQIIREYAQRYPDIFKPTLYAENNFSKGLGFLGLREGFRDAAGDFIAYCEGDDYWCDSHKLQKQVDFLLSHPKYESCAHETRIRNDIYAKEDGMLFTHTNVNLFIDRTKRNRFTFRDTLTGNIIHISSLMFRKMEFAWPEWICEVKALDLVLFMLLAEQGDMYVLRDVMSVYRHNSNSITSTQQQFSSQLAFNDISIELLERMNCYWGNRHQRAIRNIVARYYVNSMFIYMNKSHRDFAKAKEMRKMARQNNVCGYCRQLIIEFIKKIKKNIR